MRNRIEHATRQALEAHEKAASSIDNKTRAEWLRLADFWQELVREYGEFQRFSDWGSPRRAPIPVALQEH